MNIIDARKTGRQKALKTSLIVTVIAIISFMFLAPQQLSGSRASSVMTGLTNPWTIILFILFFCLTGFFGGRAGEDILLKDQNFFWVAVKYSVLIFLILSVYNIVVTCLVEKVLTTDQMIQLILSTVRFLLLLLIIWLSAGNQIRLYKEGNARL